MKHGHQHETKEKGKIVGVFRIYSIRHKRKYMELLNSNMRQSIQNMKQTFVFFLLYFIIFFLLIFIQKEFLI